MITGEQVLEIARNYLGRGPRVELQMYEGWPDGAYRPWGKQPRAVFRVFVASDVTGVGASRFVIIDADTGEVVSDQRCGE